jgi:hypothetical protein
MGMCRRPQNGIPIRRSAVAGVVLLLRVGRRGLQVEHQGERIVDSLHLLECEKACGLGEAVQIHGGDLVTHHQGAAVSDFDLMDGSWFHA